MILHFKIKKDITGFNFGLGIDFETKSIMIGLFYWCFSVQFKKCLNDIEVNL